MLAECPFCRSRALRTRNLGRKTGGSIGTLAGSVGGIAAVYRGGRIGATVGAIAGPPGTVIGGLAGAVMAGLFGGIAGASAGCALGELVDRKILDNHQCLRCGFRFSLPAGDSSPSLPVINYPLMPDDEDGNAHFDDQGDLI